MGADSAACLEIVPAKIVAAVCPCTAAAISSDTGTPTFPVRSDSCSEVKPAGVARSVPL